MRLCQSALQSSVVISRFQIVPERLSLLAKREPQEINKPVSCYAQLFLLWINGQPQHRRIDLWRRRECPRRQREQLLDSPVQLRRGREHAVVSSPGLGGNPVRNF